ncbi:unnamed protein product, partial [Mesorhabditis spiculigera]
MPAEDKWTLGVTKADGEGAKEGGGAGEDQGILAAPKAISELQLKKAMASVQLKKQAIKDAREEEKNYIEYRKKQILYEYRPRTSACLRTSDDSFPRRRRGAQMGFGERKAYYLNQRPNGQFACWFGKKMKKKKNDEAKEPKGAKAEASSNKIMTQSQPTTTADANQRSQKGSEKKAKEKEDCGDGGQAEEDDEEDEDGGSSKEKKGNNAKRCLQNGQPFWTVEKEDEEVTEDDLPIDSDIIEKVVTGEKKLDKAPFRKEKWDPFDTVENMKQMDKLFERETHLFTNTVESVIRLYPESNTKKKLKPEPHPRKVKWNPQISVTWFDKAYRQPKKERKPVKEPLKDIQCRKSAKT